jgi:hypothetical protein
VVLPKTTYNFPEYIFRSTSTISTFNNNFENGPLPIRIGEVLLYFEAKYLQDRCLSDESARIFLKDAGLIIHNNTI